jgi:prepilin-type N-terminal cleavage/methylation domain-containing protein
MRRSGFSLIEMLIVIALMGVIALFGFPRIRRTLDKINVRSARVFLGVAVATARAAAVQRGCLAVVHFASGATGKVWVTACPRSSPGAGTIDTIGAVEQLSARYNVTLTANVDSIRYDPRGLSMDNSDVMVRVVGNTTFGHDSLLVNRIGKVVR